MNHTEQTDSTLIVLGTTFCTVVIGSVLGAVTALATWDASHVTQIMGGLATGAMTALPIGFFLAWHGSAMARSPARAALAAAWGVIPSGLLGMSYRPLFGWPHGLRFRPPLGSPAPLFGLAVGPILGIFAWELAYFADDLLEGVRGRQALKHE